MFNAQRYMHMNDAYVTPHQFRIPYEMKKLFDRIVHQLQYLDTDHSHHFALDLDQLDRIFEWNPSICLIHWVSCGFIMTVHSI